jgi:hypothetical protein
MKRPIIAAASLAIFALAWNGFIHLTLLREIDRSVEHIRRADFADKTGLSIVLTAGVVFVFLWGYRRFVRNGSLPEAIKYGVFFALTAGLLVDFNLYLLLPIPAVTPFSWFIAGVGEFILYAVLARTLWPPVQNGQPTTAVEAIP